MTVISLTSIKNKSASELMRAVNPFWWVSRYKRLQTRDHFRRNLESKLLSWVSGELDGKQELHTRLCDILNYAYAHCPYYRDIFAKCKLDLSTLENFTSIPLLDKELLRNNRSRISSDELDRLDHYIMNTGGSTGEPFEFIASADAGFVDSAHRHMLYHVHGFTKGDRVASFDGSSVPSELRSKNIYWVFKGDKLYAFESLHYSSLYLEPGNIHYYIQHLQKYKPAILRGYPSFINAIAEYISDNNINLDFQVKGVDLTSEIIPDFQIERISHVFGPGVVLQYGHSEACAYGLTFDSSYVYHCSPLYGYVEVLGKNASHVQPGEIGEIVVTGFHNRAAPFIRYRTGDMAQYNGEVNGTVLLGSIYGRTQDYVVSYNGNKVSLTALVFGQHYIAFGHISQWQIEQFKPGEVIISVVAGNDFDQDDRDEIINKFRDIAEVSVDIRLVPIIPPTKRGKHKFMVQHL